MEKEIIQCSFPLQLYLGVFKLYRQYPFKEGQYIYLLLYNIHVMYDGGKKKMSDYMIFLTCIHYTYY